MDLVTVAAASLGSIVALFLLTKLIGNKQMSEMNLFDYINGITIGSIAAEMATSLESDFLKPLLAMTIYAAVTTWINYLCSKSLKFRRLIAGRSLILMDRGKLYKNNFKRARLDMEEFLAQCRLNGIFRLEDIETAFFEENGKISILPKARKQPLTPDDMKITVLPQRPQVTVIVDGKILQKNLQYAGKDAAWLTAELKKQHQKAEEIFLSVCSDSGLQIYKKIEDFPTGDIFI